jgi:plasmid stabilization system protein ParE
MAQVIWNEKASLQLEAHIDYALTEFGRKAVNNWYKDIRRIESRLSILPRSFTQEPLLADRGKEYRGAILMKNFKLIHYYDETEDIVYIDAILDMRMHPVRLRRMVK